MAEYIDIDAPIDVAVYQRNRRIQVTLRRILESNDAKYQAADVRPVVHAQWEWDGGEDMHYYCSCCHHNAYGCTCEILDGKYNFCPNCGADMEEDYDAQKTD